MRQWNKETIKEQLKLHNKQNKDERYNYFSREFNSLWYCWELEKYTISLQKELQQKENIIKEVRKYIKDNSAFLNDDEWELFNKKEIYEILDKGE